MSDRDEMANNIRGPEIYNYRFFSENYPAFSQNIWMTGWNILFIMDHFCSEACYITWRPYLMSKPTKGFHDHIDHSICSNSKTAVSVKIIDDLLDVRSPRNAETLIWTINRYIHWNIGLNCMVLSKDKTENLTMTNEWKRGFRVSVCFDMDNWWSETFEVCLSSISRVFMTMIYIHRCITCLFPLRFADRHILMCAWNNC